MHLFGDVDRALFAPNPGRPAAFDFDGARVGMLICYDVEFPEAVRRLAVDGARTVLVPTANMAGFEVVQQVLVPRAGLRERLRRGLRELLRRATTCSSTTASA